MMSIYAMNGANELLVSATKNFVKSANVSGKSFCLGGGKAFFEKSEEPFLGRKGHRACIKTLSFKPVPVSHDADGLLLLTFCVPVLKVRFHRLPVPSVPLHVKRRAAAIPKIRFKSSLPPFSDFIGFGHCASC